jgi:hypothetical protein
MKDRYRNFIVPSIIVILGIVSSISIVRSNVEYTQKEQEIINQGLNEYIDPSKAPIYNQEYTVIEYKDNAGKDKKDKLEKILPKATDERLEVSLQYTDNTTDKLKDKKQNKQVKSLSVNLDKVQKEEIQGKKEEYGIKNITSIPNKEIMDGIYPSKEKIDKINSNIQQEKQQILDYEKQVKVEENKKLSLQDKFKNFIQGNKAEALKLSNANSHLVIYADYNLNYNLDLIGNGQQSGNELQIYGRNNTQAQDFWFNDLTGEIKPSQNSNMCIEVAGGQYYDGTKIQLHYCNGNIAQKWETWPDRTIRAQGAKWLCMDAKDSLTIGKKVQGWTCYGGVNQKFLVGENDFTQYSTGRYMRIHARNTWTLSQFPGHALISVGKRNYNTKQCWATNSFSNWPIIPFTDKQPDTNDSNNNGKTNNIKTNNNIHVDKDEDWSEAIGNSTIYRKRDLNIDKRTYDEIKYMNGYYAWSKNFWNDSVLPYGPLVTGGVAHCATYSRDFWSKYTGEWMGNLDLTPGQIYNTIWWYNEDPENKGFPDSQCGKGY